ncbi:cytochrome b [Pseudoxanthomonas mexicana]|uniref:cytochrome b n=1 Tax=Pseudoxanthomonas mexicana TaxID=128785 RepID=UPI0022F398EE|nr:cytochrome b [Pseudoxanthomonas mexicana]WBX93136.1 cytochrome b [Pseudoxanthomonas mexicana]
MRIEPAQNPTVTAEAPTHYSRLARWLHWTTFGMVVAAYVSINARKLFERGSDERILAVESHFLVGMVILMLTLPRLANRLKGSAPIIVPPQPLLSALLSKATHVLLYAFLIVQPLSGFVARLAEGKGIGLPFTERVIPSFFGTHEALAASLESAHVWIGEAFYWVIGLHILAAFFHLLVRKDNVMQRMTGGS